MKGKEANIRTMIADQERKISRAKNRIEELNMELSRYLSSKQTIHVTPVEPTDSHDYCGKILYSSKKEANSARKLINRDLAKKGKPPMKRAYLCKQCEAWHLTSIPHWMPYPENENNELLSERIQSGRI